MEIDSRILMAAVAVFAGVCLLLQRMLHGRNRDLKVVAAEKKQVEHQFLRMRGEHAMETADLKAEHARQVAALQANLNDLTALLKEQRRPHPLAPKR